MLRAYWGPIKKQLLRSVTAFCGCEDERCSVFAFLLNFVGADIFSRHNGRDGMFVDQLIGGVVQHNNKLVKRLYRALQFDAIHQKYGYWDAVFSQCIQKGVL